MSIHVGLDLGGTTIKAVAIDSSDRSNPRIIETARTDTQAERGPDEVTRTLIEAGKAMLDQVGTSSSVGVGVPGLFEADSGEIVLFPNLPGPWAGHSLRGPIEEALGLPATLINDARAFVLAEGTIGAGRGHDIIVGITLGTGIGGGIMIDGRIHLGAFGTAGEIGHQIVEVGGPQCGCGNHGCVEPFAMASTLSRLAGSDDPAEIYALAAAGDEDCRAAVEQVARYIGVGLANAITLLGPSCIVVGGGISNAGESVLGPIRDSVRRHVTLAPVDRIAIVQAELGSWAGAVGAALAGRAHLDVRSK